MAGQAVQPAKAVQLVEGKLAERDQDGVEARRVVALGGEKKVAVLELVEIEPRTRSRLEKLEPMWPEPARAIM